MTARVYTVPAGVPFLPALARAILNGELPEPGGQKLDPLSLPDITLLLPTRRAARAAQDAFLEASGAKALLMPRIRPISLGDEEGGLIAALSNGTAPDALDVPPAMSALARTLTLMQLIRRWQGAMESSATNPGADAKNTAAQAAALATGLASLMDEVERENVPLSGLSKLVPETYSAHWQTTVEFLKIITEMWPTYLAAQNLISPEARRNTIILNEAARIAAQKADAPVIVAGVTGSIPATVTLMKAVLGQRHGAIVLPALDTLLDDESWQRIVPDHPEHPQFGLIKLLKSLDVTREEVKLLPGSTPSTSGTARNGFISEVFRPSATTDRWQAYTGQTGEEEIKQALDGLHLSEAPNAQDEAEAVSLILRHAVETPGRTAALVSPDRLLARRVAIRLEAWGIRVDDSAGRPFAKTVPGTFLNLVIDAAAKHFAPAETMALLKHPLCRLGFKAFDIRRFARALELLVFRAPYLGKGLEGILATLDKREGDRGGKSLEHLHPAAQRLWDEDRTGARDLAAKLHIAFEPLTAIFAAPRPHKLADIASAHARVAETLTAMPADEAASEDAGNPLWQGEAGSAAHLLFTGLLDPELPEISTSAAEYPDLYRTLVARENIRERTPVHPRVAIWGPFEARLQHADVLILGSLNEGTWPEFAEPGAWLNRPMRSELGLPLPEQDVGRAAHDVFSMLGSKTVYMTRAEKMNGVPSVPSRWLMRMTALLNSFKIAEPLAPEQPWLAWARSRNAVDETKRVLLAAPEPCPPVEMRPRKMSVTRIEDWLRNPYAVFARSILKLQALSPLGLSPDQALRGALVHEVLSQFASRHPATLPNDMDGELNRIARDVLQSYTGHPKVAAFWMPRLSRFLTWFAETEPARRTGVKRVVPEIEGSLVIAGPAGPFRLSARADRIDDGTDGLAIIDYKTGTVPSNASVLSGRSPQLPLEAAIAIGGTGFTGLAGRPVASLTYIRASGGEPPGQETHIKTDDVAKLAREAQSGLEGLIALFDDPLTPYRAIRRPGYGYDYDDYALLARVAEWSAHAEDEGGA